MSNALPLECYDPRDKLYGIIAVVSWTGLQKPMPDYTCDVFDLVLETLPLLAQESKTDSDEPGTETGLPWLVHAIHPAENVLKYFNLLTQSSEKFAASIEKRSKGISAELERIDSIITRYEDGDKWSGYELTLNTNDFEWPRARGNAEFDNSEESDFGSNEGGGSGVRVVMVSEKFNYADGVFTDAHGRLRGLLPSSTRSGDWLVTAKRRSLVIRRRPDDKYDLIGQAIAGGILPAVLGSNSRELGSFRMAFYLEDPLAFAQNEKLATPSRISPDTISSTLSLTSHQELVYFSPGLSHADRVQGK